ncbi:putative versatile peroxidase [Mycena olivaceomarginata]|nr:putative versatile peroxidase [Mycena olivaceomarginata]
MKFSTLSTLSLVYATSVLATPSFPSLPQRATCSNGRTASSATCCVWYNVLDDLQANVFDHRCEEDAHDALRLSFHDAISYSPNLQRQGKFGGLTTTHGCFLDGSLIKFLDIELEDPANEGLETIYGVSYGDIIQFAGAVSVRNCLFGPRIAFMAGRPAATQAAPAGLIPAPFDNVTTMLARVGDAGLTPEELIDLLASHSIASQKVIDETIPNTPFDLTPEIFDNNFYREVCPAPGLFTPGSTLHTGEVKSPFPNEFRLQSDFALARDVRTKSHWVSLSLNQLLMQSRFATAMAKMALIGQNSGILHDCSDVIP